MKLIKNILAGLHQSLYNEIDQGHKLTFRQAKGDGVSVTKLLRNGLGYHQNIGERLRVTERAGEFIKIFGKVMAVFRNELQGHGSVQK
jgi:hypothetical protein